MRRSVESATMPTAPIAIVMLVFHLPFGLVSPIRVEVSISVEVDTVSVEVTVSILVVVFGGATIFVQPPVLFSKIFPLTIAEVLVRSLTRIRTLHARGKFGGQR